MKIKDLDSKKNLSNVRFVYPTDGQTYYWVSQWQKGVWGRKKLGDIHIYPLFVGDLLETLEWEVVE